MTIQAEAPVAVERGLTDPEITDHWVAVARSLAPLVESEVAQGTEDKLVTRKVVQAWKDAGLYRLLVPTQLGGEGLDSASFLAVAEEVSRQDASAGWTFAIHTVGSMFPGLLLPESSYRMIVGENADRIACGFAFGKVPGTARPVDGGYLVESEPMPFGSGTQHVDRVACKLFLLDRDGERVIGDDGAPTVVSAYIDPIDVQWLHNWDPAGLHGTGSGFYRVTEHVLEEQWLSLAPGERVSDPVFSQGFLPLVHLHHSSVALGICKRAIEEVAKSAKGRRRGEVPALDENGVFQSDFVRIDSLYQSARALLMSAYQQVWEAACVGQVSELQTARVEQADHYAHRVLRDIVSTASVWAGSDAIPRDNVFARLSRDTAVALNHLMLSPHQTANFAPALLADAQTVASNAL
ncbi:acyl-CoA dehydrogenase family protein [Rhodococcus qingshengii]|uniref:acyl-CoA dehydrogenase family protein n=1 Tax=Rhodococcus qingshengii TaxID=334542 RepID=UPI0010A6A7C2|nr:acyl-CoA dehydrogenase family protein [Rhodococcus qingshengii]THJ64711.1 hypothetical protein EU244_31065 [Rhodococcus qingshengii]